MSSETLPFLTGHAVQEIQIWGPFRLIFDGEPSSRTELDVEGPAELTIEGTTGEISFFSDGRPAEAAMLLQLLWKQVVAAFVEEGVLSIAFEDGAVFRALPWKGESWRLRGGGRSLICLPGGGLAVYSG